MVLAGSKRAPVGEDSVADELVGDALVFENDVSHLGEVFVEQRDQLHGIGAFAERGEVAHVREEDGQLALLASQIDGVKIGKNVIDQGRRDVAVKRAAGATQLASCGGIADRSSRYKRQEQRKPG